MLKCGSHASRNAVMASSTLTPPVPAEKRYKDCVAGTSADGPLDGSDGVRRLLHVADVTLPRSARHKHRVLELLLTTDDSRLALLHREGPNVTVGTSSCAYGARGTNEPTRMPLDGVDMTPSPANDVAGCVDPLDEAAIFDYESCELDGNPPVAAVEDDALGEGAGIDVHAPSTMQEYPPGEIDAADINDPDESNDAFAARLIERQGYASAYKRLRSFPEAERWTNMDIMQALFASRGLAHPARRALATMYGAQ